LDFLRCDGRIGSGRKQGGCVITPRLESILIASLVAFLGTGALVAAGQDREDQPGPARRGPAPAAAGGAANRMDMERLLKLWERQSALLKTLEVLMYRIDKTPGWDEDHYEGHAAFRSPQLAYLDFRKVKTRLDPDPKDPKKKQVVPLVDARTRQRISVPHQSIICTGTEVWHYRYEVRQIFIYTLNANQQQRALEEGPLPFLFNMNAADAHRRYEMALQGENDRVYFVVIKPKLKEDMEAFRTAWVFLDRKYLLPTRIVLFEPDGKSTQDYRVEKTWANQPVEDKYFRGVDPGKPWKIERNAGADKGPIRAGRPGRRRDVGGQAARRQQPADAEGPR
jgi:TIGR03009 family protein